MEAKACRLCGEVQPLEQFYAAAGMRDGQRNECKACFKARAAARYRENPEPVKQRARTWAQENPERRAEYQRQYRESGRRRVVDRRSHLKRTFGITPGHYDELLAAQGGGCRLCGKPPRADAALHVDHDHQTGAVRGLLCFDCNAGIGKLREDRELLRAAARYLDDHDPEVAELRALVQERVLALRR